MLVSYNTYICLLQIVLLPWRTFGRNLPEPRIKQESDAAAVKVAEELKAEQAAHCQSKKVIAEMAIN